MMTDQLKYHLERQEDLEACCQLLSNILEVLYRNDVFEQLITQVMTENLCLYLPVKRSSSFRLQAYISKKNKNRTHKEPKLI
uniref:Dedicator of cytokinesis protein 1 n=1 Tax=Sphaerodactylus townsendi TaxID=933632 RepID=A0ACB8F967_9SAUR